MRIPESAEQRAIIGKAWKSSITGASATDNRGWMLGRWWIGYLYVSGGGGNMGESRELYIFGLKKFITTSHEEKPKETGTATVSYMYREGNYWSLNYRSRPYPVSRLDPRSASQQNAIEAIFDAYEASSVYSTVALLYGEPGTGKSKIAALLAKRLANKDKIEEVTICKYWKPWEPNDSLGSMYSKISPSAEKPLILVLEEVDIPLLKIHENKVDIKNEHLPISIRTKDDWNLMLDEIDDGLFPHMILLLTSNRTPVWFDAMDASYLRKGRVGTKMEITNN
jgi:hypothetical protein